MPFVPPIVDEKNCETNPRVVGTKEKKVSAGRFRRGNRSLCRAEIGAWISGCRARGFTPIRVDAGSATRYTDTLGQVWAAGSGFTGCGGTNAYPNAPIGCTTTAPGVY